MECFCESQHQTGCECAAMIVKAVFAGVTQALGRLDMPSCALCSYVWRAWAKQQGVAAHACGGCTRRLCHQCARTHAHIPLSMIAVTLPCPWSLAPVPPPPPALIHTPRLQRVPMSQGVIPLDLLVKASSLDVSQARALAACLTQELALVQGPPGTGEAGGSAVSMTCMA